MARYAKTERICLFHDRIEAAPENDPGNTADNKYRATPVLHAR